MVPFLFQKLIVRYQMHSLVPSALLSMTVSLVFCDLANTLTDLTECLSSYMCLNFSHDWIEVIGVRGRKAQRGGASRSSCLTYTGAMNLVCLARAVLASFLHRGTAFPDLVATNQVGVQLPLKQGQGLVLLLWVGSILSFGVHAEGDLFLLYLHQQGLVFITCLCLVCIWVLCSVAHIIFSSSEMRSLSAYPCAPLTCTQPLIHLF